jgi:hypothetical protein
MMINADSGGVRRWRALLDLGGSGPAVTPRQAGPGEAAALPAGSEEAPASAATAPPAGPAAQLPAWRRLQALY